MIKGKNAGTKSFLTFWFPVVFYSGIIFYVSSLSHVQAPLSEINFDKVLHIVEYMPFGFLLARALKNTRKSFSGITLTGAVFVLSLLYGLSDEYHQSFVMGRDSSMMDVFADSIGGGIGCWIYSRSYKES